jgi:MFS family permease
VAEKLSPLRAIAPLAAIVFLGFLTIGLPLPALPRQVHDVLGFGPVVVGWVVGLQSLVTVATRGLGGAVVDGRGPKTSVMLGMPCALAAGIAYLASSFLLAQPLVSLILLFAGRVLLGFAESLFLTGTLAWSIGRAGTEHTGRAMAWQGLSMYLAIGLGAPVGLALQQRYGFTVVSLAVVALPLVAMAVVLALPRPVHTGSRAAGSFLKAVGIIWPQGLSLALGTAPFAAMAAFLPLHFDSHGWSGAGIALGAFAAGYVGVRLFLAHLPDRVGGSQVALASLAVEVVGQVILWRAGAEWVALAGSVVTGMGFSLVFPSFGVQAMRKAPPELRGMCIGAFMAFFDVSLGLTGPLAGVVAGRFGFDAVFLTTLLSTVAAIAVALVARPRKAG